MLNSSRTHAENIEHREHHESHEPRDDRAQQREGNKNNAKPTLLEAHAELGYAQAPNQELCAAGEDDAS